MKKTVTKLGHAPLIHDGCSVTKSEFGVYCEVGKGSNLHNVVLGDYSYCARLADIANARIGKFSNIAALARIGATDHPLHTASLHHFLYRSADYWDDIERDAAWFAKRESRLTHIGHDTWIGAGAQVKPEVTVGHGAVVGAGAMVTKDVAPYTIVAGNPATLIRRRQPEPIAERLMTLGWWDWSHARLRETLDDFRAMTAEAFLEKYEP